ncbi:MAG: tRNA (N(6)-L-threonylcarbamoyladenosine(37)-C(2))-methylthiotransferase MtaB [Pirellulales bacterium]|nr:tRNA (N(6)-L-threonylcarbamoyladenosine(37)-C(2))-methylthiotransferase MtaB [Pirellulales bacterium]
MLSADHPSATPRLRTVTLGCKVNQYETELVRQGFIDAGYIDAVDDQFADLCLVNTCTVTHEGDSKSRQTIRQLAKQNPHSRIVVMGCYATRAPDEVAALPNVVQVITDKRELPDLLGRWGVAELPGGIQTFSHHQRAFIKVQDGCLLRCTFCIIPQVRPHVISRPPESILSEVRGLLAAGYHEFVLTGIHLGHYGVEQNAGKPKSEWLRLSRLLRQLMELDADLRIRLSSIECTEVTRELIDVCAANPVRIAPHFHICLQSGSAQVLRRMGRRWGPERFIARCQMLQRAIDLPAITTDIIVGFPGETDADFEETLAVARAVGFAKIHVFPYSPRRGTIAANFTDQVPAAVRQERVERLNALDADLRSAYLAKLRGHQLRVLVEQPVSGRPGWVYGTSCRYAVVECPGNISSQKQFLDVIAKGIQGSRLQGDVT